MSTRSPLRCCLFAVYCLTFALREKSRFAMGGQKLVEYGQPRVSLGSGPAVVRHPVQ